MDSAAPRGAGRDVAIVLLACVLVFWLLLGRSPFRQSEGLRVAPAWAMLDSGNWLRTEMFELNYVRKPPGMPWAIAASSAVFGRNEFAARFPSALACTLMALVALAFGRAWFGPAGGLAAGLAQASLPLMWSPGRAAEIEALNTFATQLAVLPIVALAVPLGGAVRRSIAVSMGLALMSAVGILGFAVVKGPASAPCVAGVVIGACIALRSAWPVVSGWVWGAVVVGGGAGWLVLREIARINNDADAVRETGEFLWRDPGGVAALVPMALLAALPLSLALVVPLGRDARAEGEAGDEQWRLGVQAARVCAFAWLASAAIFVVIGVDNPRYLMPASVFLAPIVGYVVRGAWGGGGQGPFARAGFGEKRRELVRRAVVRGPGAWAGVLIAAGMLVNTRVLEPPATSTGRTAGEAIAAKLPDGAVVWADDLIEARPDVLLYARAAAEGAGRTMRPIWAKPRMARGEMPEPSEYLLIRVDAESGEAERYAAFISSGKLSLIAEGEVSKYRFVLVRVAASED